MDKLNPNYNPFADVVSNHEANELRDIYYKVKVLNEQNKIVAHCKTREEAEENIRLRKMHAPLAGYAPKIYTIKTVKTKKIK